MPCTPQRDRLDTGWLLCRRTISRGRTRSRRRCAPPGNCCERGAPRPMPQPRRPLTTAPLSAPCSWPPRRADTWWSPKILANRIGCDHTCCTPCFIDDWHVLHWPRQLHHMGGMVHGPALVLTIAPCRYLILYITLAISYRATESIEQRRLVAQ